MSNWSRSFLAIIRTFRNEDILLRHNVHNINKIALGKRIILTMFVTTELTLFTAVRNVLNMSTLFIYDLVTFAQSIWWWLFYRMNDVGWFARLSEAVHSMNGSIVGFVCSFDVSRRIVSINYTNTNWINILEYSY